MMSATQLRLPLRDFDRLTPFSRTLYALIVANADPATGTVTSLFDIAVRRGGLDYAHAHYSLVGLELLGYVEVRNRRPGFPLVIRPLV